MMKQKWMKLDVESVNTMLVKNLKYAFENNLFDVVKKTFESLVLNDKIGLLSCREYIVDSDGNSPLFWACNVGNLKLVKLLVEEYCFPLNYQNNEGCTALVVAVLGGYGDVVSYLLAKGANPNVCNLKKESPLHIACCLNEIGMCEMLLKNGAWIEAEDENGETTLHWSVREDNIEISELLIRYGANPDHPNEDEDTPREMTKLSTNDDIINLFDSSGNDLIYPPSKNVTIFKDIISKKISIQEYPLMTRKIIENGLLIV